MPLKKIDFSKTLFYTVKSKDDDKFSYLGFTTDITRAIYNMKTQKKSFLGNLIINHGGIEKMIIQKVKDFPSNESKEVYKELDKLADEIKCTHRKQMAVSTDMKQWKKSWYIDKKERISCRRKKQREEKTLKKIQDENSEYLMKSELMEQESTVSAPI